MKKSTIKSFNTLCKKTAKNGRLYLQDSDNYVYICDGCFIVKMDRYTFDISVKPDLIFDVPENDMVTINKNRSEAGSLNIKSIFEDRKPEKPECSAMTSLILDNGVNPARIFKSETGFTAIAVSYVDALSVFGFDGAIVDGNSPAKSPLKTDNFIIMPINADIRNTLKEVMDFKK